MAVDAGVWPSGGAGDDAVFDGVVVDVVSVVGIVADEVFPITPLPDAAFASSLARGAAVFGGRNAFAEIFLDASPTTAEIAVSARQRCDAMQMIGKDDPGIDAESPFSGSIDHRRFQLVDFANEQIVAVTFEQIHREEVGASRLPEASIVRHDLRFLDSIRPVCQFRVAHGTGEWLIDL